jgi:urocanate hydratase
MDSPHNLAQARAVRAPRGTALSCKGWPQEAALRMMMNSLDPDVAENSGELIACGCCGRVARDWSAFDATIGALRSLGNDETIAIRQGAVNEVLRSSAESPRALILDSDRAASWTYIGPQEFVSLYYELLAESAHAHFAGVFSGKLVATCGMGAAGGAFGLAASMHGAAFLGIEVDAEHVKRRVKTGYCDVMVNDLDEALRILKNAVRKGEPASVGLVSDAAKVMPELAGRGVVPDLLANHTPPGTRDGYSEAVVALFRLGAKSFDADCAPSTERLPVRWVALSGEPSDARRIDQFILQHFADDEPLCQWIQLVRRRLKHFGLPVRACWLSTPQRCELALAINDLVARGELKAPVAIICEDQRQSAPVVESAAAGSINQSAMLRLTEGTGWSSIHTGRVSSNVFVADGKPRAWPL